MKRIVMAAVLLGLFAAAVLAGACGGTEVPTGAVAVVGDETVTQQQFDDILAQAKAQYASAEGDPEFPPEGSPEYDQLKSSIVTYLVQNAMIAQKAAEMDLAVTDKELDDRIKQITEQYGGQKKLDELLEKQGVTMDQLTTQLRAQMLGEKVQTKITDEIAISDKQIKDYFNDPANKAQFEVPDTVTARHVLVKTKAEALEVQKLLEADASDANWKAVAKKYSEDPSSKDTGGDLGTFDKSRMVEPFADAAFDLEVNTVSVPVKTQYGWHVIEVTEKTPGSTKTFDEAKDMIEQSLRFEQATKAWEEWLKTTKEELGIAYALGFDPAELTASPSPAGSAAGSASPAAAE